MTTASNSRVLRTIPLLIAFCLVSMPAQAQYGGGMGEPNNPYRIATAEDLNDIGNHEEDWDKCFILVNDIDLSAYTDTQFNVIGRWFEWGHPDNKAFSGVFDGDGKVIRNFTWSSVDRDTVALFAFLDWNGTTVKNLGLEEVNIRAENGGVVAALAARSGGEIANCYVTGYISGRRLVGGLVAYADDGSVVDCYSLAIVEGDQYVGGLVGGTSEDANIGRCYSCCVVAGNDSVGGLVGYFSGSLRYSFSNSTVTGDSRVGGLVGVNNVESGTVDCYARGSVTGTTRVGGLAGVNADSEDEGPPGLIHRCYSSATVRGEGEHIGGLVGDNYGGKVSDSFWDIETSGQITSDRGTGKTTAEMQTYGTFLGWDACGDEATWTIEEGNDYPRLWWENQPGEPIVEVLSGLLTGSGTEDDPYLIYTAEELNVIGVFPCEWDKHFKLMADVDLIAYTGTEFNIIGNYGDWYFPDNNPFTGVFDGNGHTISNFSYTSTAKDYIGLFGNVSGKNTVIKDVGLIDPNVDGTFNLSYLFQYIGSLVGKLQGGTISNCYAEGGSVSGDDNVGGLVGENSNGTITGCYVDGGNVSGVLDVGGLLGKNWGTIIDCYTSASVSGIYRVGGLLGWNSSGTITNCYSVGSVTGTTDVGGLVGFNRGNITTSYSTGTVTGNEVGGFVGRNLWESAVVSTCFWDTETSGLLNMCGRQYDDATGCDDSYGKTTAEMQTASTFLEAGWDFAGETVNGPNDIWKISEGLDYPRLWWEKYGGGRGEPNDPYQIATAEELMLLGETPEDYDKHFILTADIDLDPNLPCRKVFDKALIATEVYNNPYTFHGTPFTGIFDGNGHTLSHLTINGAGFLGLFGQLASGAEVKNLGVVDVNITGSGYYVGGLVGYNFTGFGEGGYITTSYSTGVVSGNERVGGLVGGNTASLTKCYSTVSVSGNMYVGGLVGRNSGAVSQCYSTGKVSGNEYVGGLVGFNNGGDIATSFWDIEASGQTNIDGGTGLKTAEMQDIQTYLDGGWDFLEEFENGTSEIWQIPEEGGYPVLVMFNGYTPPQLQGQGTAEEPYLISDAMELGAMVHRSLYAHYRLVASIDLSGIHWSTAVIPTFAGTFDGNGHTISNLTIEGMNGLGLFGRLGYGAEVRDIGVVDVNITASGNGVGGLVWRNYGMVNACYSNGAIIGKGSVGGLVGANFSNYSTVIHCYSNSTVSGTHYVGGLVGGNWKGNITTSYSTGMVSGNSEVGGLVGINGGDGNVKQCYSTGSVSGGIGLGGLVGQNGGDVIHCYSTGGINGNERVGGLVGSNGGALAYCYSIGSVSGTGDYVGGLIGCPWVRGSFRTVYGDVSACFWDTQTSGQATSGGGIGLTTSGRQPVPPSTLLLDAGWDFVDETANGTDDIWWILEGKDYPRLWWEDSN